MKKVASTTPEQQLSEAIAELRTGDALTQNEAVKQLIQLGTAAVTELLNEIKKPEANHQQVMYALSQIADSKATEAFKGGLNHIDQYVRAYAAQGLTHINHPSAMNACLNTINDAASEAHLDITPSVSALADMKLQVVPELLKLMMHHDEMTRLHAQRVLEQLLNKSHGFIHGRGFASQEDGDKAQAEWQDNGNYDYAADEATRAAAIAKWQQWLESVEE